MKKATILFFWLCHLLPLASMAQDNLTYQTPPKPIADLINAPVTPQVSVNAKGTLLLLLQTAGYPGIAELAEPELRIAGLRINPKTNGPSRMSYTTGLSLKNISTGKETTVTGLPANPLISNIRWSPDDSRIAFCVTEGADIQLYVLDVATATARKLPATRLNSVLTSPFEWLSDNKTILFLAVPENRGPMPEASAVPSGPIVQENINRKAASRTYQDLLKNPYDEALFDYYATAQLRTVQLETGRVTSIGKPAIYQNYSPSPDGRYLLTQTLHHPYSYLVPVWFFPQKVAITDLQGNEIKAVTDLPLADNIPIGFNATRVGQRDHDWRNDAPATLYWVEAQDGGDPKKDVSVRDKVYTLDAPFTGVPRELASTQLRYASIRWGNDNLALMTERWWNNRKEVIRMLSPKTGTSAVLFDRSYEDTYTDPGKPELTKNAYGRYVLELADNNLIMLGQGASAEGDRPFVDLLNVQTKKTTRLWRSAAPYYEQPIQVLDWKRQVLLTRRESPTENPNYYIRNLKARMAPVAVTQFPHPYPQMKDVQKQLLTYKRADGVDLSATLYLPAGYKKEDGPLPALLYAYPQEFKTKDAAGQVTGSPHSFTYISWAGPVFWVTQGYAVLDRTSIPIVGEGKKEPNDTYIEQLVAGAKAAIDEGARLGVVDANRVGVMGHSYGAFMTANLLSHSNLFKAGIARSGAYNRTLTPFGFQAEERTYWQAPDIYFNMAPFSHADKIKTPILLIHGEADNNSGTFPIQSERYYNAIKGHGGTARYVVLPYESHSYRGKESILHMLWEMNNWLEVYVKNHSSKQ